MKGFVRMITARKAREIVRTWVMEEGSRVQGFGGAFFHGSINWLGEEDSLPATSDVDVMIVVEGPGPPEKLGKILYQGVVIEASYLPAEQIQSAEAVLGISHLAGSLQAASIIADPTGQLARLQSAVSTGYTKKEWVYRRCEHARNKVLAHLKGLDAAQPFHDQVAPWLFGTGVTTHVLLAAGLKNLTVRKRYLAVRELLAQYGRSDFYASLLKILGCADMNQARAEQHLAALTSAFDTAKVVIHTPFPFAADISDLARPVAIDGSRELIENGDQCEAVFWIVATYSRCQKVLYHDAPEGIQEQHTPGYQALLADLRIGSYADLQQRSQQVRDLLPRVWKAAEAIMAANPEIT
jgi:hypothetical protein